MFKRILCAFLIIVCVALCAKDVPLLNKDFKEGLKYWSSTPSSVPGFEVADDKGTKCLVATGVADKNKQANLCLQRLLDTKDEKILSKRVIFGAEFNPEKISGTLKLMIREINDKGKTIRYRKIILDKWSKPGWEKRSSAFVVDPPTSSLAIYILSSYLQPGDKILIKNIFIQMTDYKR